MAMEATKYKQEGHEVIWGPVFLKDFMTADKIIREPEGLPFLTLPRPNRLLTQAFNPRYQENGNYKYHPGTYIQSANGCWWGKCSFCVEGNNKWEVRPVNDVIREIEECRDLGFKEVFDDSGSFPTGGWLDDFLRHGHFNLALGCNMRMVDLDYRRLRHVGFRMLLFGIESANQYTLDQINKGTKTEDVKYIIQASKAGIEAHIAVMFGFPWETDKDALNTLRLVHYLLRKGYAKTAQASFDQPPQGPNKPEHHKFVRKIYNAAYSPEFWFNKIKDIKNVDDLKYIWLGIKKGLSDYKRH
jgi:radical SAM superfamily enzyme YgiQ (UPF0313 family)